MKLLEIADQHIYAEFLKFAVNQLDLQQQPAVQFSSEPVAHTSFGTFSPDDQQIRISVQDRHPADVLRTLAHELVHQRQHEQGQLNKHSGKTGSAEENQAHAQAGVLLRRFAQLNPQLFTPVLLEQLRIDNQQGMGATLFNQQVRYRGLRVLMTPEVFLRLALPLPFAAADAQRTQQLADLMRQGQAIAAPFLIIALPDTWRTDITAPESAWVQGHEGRHRMLAAQHLQGQTPVETHLFFGPLHRRDVTEQIIQRVRRQLIPQGRTLSVAGAFFELSADAAVKTDVKPLG